MNFYKLLESLTEKEIDFISKLDYGEDSERHKTELLKVINNYGEVDMQTQDWYPYEVIELGSNWLQKGHEKEFTVCTAIVFKNILEKRDLTNDLNFKLDNHTKDYEKLPKLYYEIIYDFITKLKTTC